jgi:hypothetical protein
MRSTDQNLKHIEHWLDKSDVPAVNLDKVKRRFSTKMARVLLALSVSIWMAGGGCIFGCSNLTMAANVSPVLDHDANVVVAGESCHQMRSHDCCAKAKSTSPKASDANHGEESLGLIANSSGMMNECPLLLNSTAASVKGNGDLHETPQAPVSPLFQLQGHYHQRVVDDDAPLKTNRGPTYLRCCVFLI